MAGTEPCPVVLLHGLWSPRAALGYWGWWLRRAGFATTSLAYHPVRRSLEDSARALAAFLKPLPAPVHLVGHSLGGVITRVYGHLYGWDQVARVVMVGTPNSGPQSAEWFARFPLGPALMGKSIAEVRAGALAGMPWRGPPLGLIAGSRGGFPKRGRGAYDGLVAADEVWLEGAQDRLLLPVSHTGMLLSPRVARAIGAFLAHGRFEASAEPARAPPPG